MAPLSQIRKDVRLKINCSFSEDDEEICNEVVTGYMSEGYMVFHEYFTSEHSCTVKDKTIMYHIIELTDAASPSEKANDVISKIINPLSG